jgi:pimeloyl-ACP methyl ester carboxylesterase
MQTSTAHLLAALLKGIKMDIESPKPTIVLVHGAVEDSSLWTHGVIQGLQRDGYPVKVFSNPLRGLAVDTAYLRSLLDTIDGPVILVSHAYGGAVITQGGNDPKLRALSTRAPLCPEWGNLQTIVSIVFPAATSPPPPI